MTILTWVRNKRVHDKVIANPSSTELEIYDSYLSLASRNFKRQWNCCGSCGILSYVKDLAKECFICPNCKEHLRMTTNIRLMTLVDRRSWRSMDDLMSPCDPLKFKDKRTYTERLGDAQELTGDQDAVQTGTACIRGMPIALGIMTFAFMGGSMGSVVGEKITRLIEYATEKGLPVILLSASGGARMQEGAYSLMQMAKISAALYVHQIQAKLLFISVITSPTTGGVTASFAMLGDIIIAEPNALIGFAGRRVIQQTLQESLPDDFQTSEYLYKHGFIDLIVKRDFLRATLSEIMDLNHKAPYKQRGQMTIINAPKEEFTGEFPYLPDDYDSGVTKFLTKKERDAIRKKQKEEREAFKQRQIKEFAEREAQKQKEKQEHLQREIRRVDNLVKQLLEKVKQTKEKSNKEKSNKEQTNEKQLTEEISAETKEMSSETSSEIKETSSEIKETSSEIEENNKEN